MQEAVDCCLVMTTVDSEAVAEALARQLVESQLAACVQLLPIRSFYVWNGQSRRDAEILLLIKTRPAMYAALEAFIVEKHPYDTPELLQLPVTAGWPDYLRWVLAATPGTTGRGPQA